MCSTNLNVSTKEESFATMNNLWQKYSRELRWQTLFTLPHWLETWWEILSPPGKLYLRSVWNKNELCGIAPFYLKNGTAYMLGSVDLCDYRDLPMAAGQENIFCGALLEDLSQNGVNRIELGLVRSDSVLCKGLSSFLESRENVETLWEEKDVSFEMELAADWESYLKSLPKKQRHEVRRKLRRVYEAAKVAYSELQGESITPELLQTFFTLFAVSREDKAAFLTPAREAFFRKMVERMSRDGVLRMGLLELNDKPVGMTLHLVHNGRVYLYNSGHDPQYRSISPGLLTKVFCIKESINQQRQFFDFLKGREIFKHRLGGQEVPLYECAVKWS